jgi:hypothetical protein
MDGSFVSGIDVVRKRRRIRHAREFTHLPRGLRHQEWRARSGRLLPVDAFEKHRQLGASDGSCHCQPQARQSARSQAAC